MIKRRNLRTQNIKVFVLDEADEMLNKGKPIFIIFHLSLIFSHIQGSRSRFTMCIGFSHQLHRYDLSCDYHMTIM